jgi:hypothetical protein
VEEGQIIQWSTEERQKDKQHSIKCGVGIVHVVFTFLVPCCEGHYNFRLKRCWVRLLQFVLHGFIALFMLLVVIYV